MVSRRNEKSGYSYKRGVVDIVHDDVGDVNHGVRPSKSDLEVWHYLQLKLQSARSTSGRAPSHVTSIDQGKKYSTSSFLRNCYGRFQSFQPFLKPNYARDILENGAKSQLLAAHKRIYDFDLVDIVF